MKTAFASVLFALTLGASSASFAQTATEPTPFATKLYAVEGGSLVDVIVQNPDAKRLTVRIVDARGVTLASQSLLQTKTATRTRFDLSDLNDGNYRIEVSDGKTKQVEAVNLTTRTPAVSPRTITVG
jgi:hypothetical protein